MFESLSQRTVIIGNSGAGKSALAESLAALILVPVIDLDLLNWEGDSYGRKRDEDAARRMTLEVSAQPLWIIEGVYGWLVEVALPRATALIWLDHGAFAVPDCSHVVHVEEQRIRTPWSF